ncbi:MAG: CAP domain-containing protein [Polyangiaceae bacterium]
MRRLAYLLVPLLPLGSACATVDPAGGFAGEYGQYSGSGGASGEDSGASPPEQQGSTPSPITHHDAGSWGTHDAQAPGPVVTPPPPVEPDSDAGSPSPSPGDDGGTPIADDSGGAASEDSGSTNAALLAACAGGVNAFRGQNDLFAYTRSAALEAYAAQAAASDALSGQQDGFFNGNGGNNVSFAEDEFDGDQVDRGATAIQLLQQGLLDEEEGEINGNGNLLSQQFSEVGCGVAQASDGSYWITIEYQ